MKKMTDKDNWPLASDFLESTVNLDNESFITEVYRTYLLREADENGRKDYLRFLTQGQLTREQMLDGFQNSPEFNLVWQSKAEIDRRQKTLLIRQNLGSVEPPIPGNKEFLESTAELSDRLFVTATYRTFLLREPDAGGLKGYIQLLSKGQLRREQMLDGFQNSPEFELVWQSAVNVNWRQKTLLEQQQQQKEAIAICQEALKLYKESPPKDNSTENDPELSSKVTEIAEVYHQKAVDLAKTRQLSVAIAYWEKSVEFKPDFTQAWGEMGDALLKVGQVSRGIDCYYQALNLQPEFVNAYKKCIQEWKNDGTFLEWKNDGTFLVKIADFLKALQTEPHSLSVYKYFGEILAVNRNFVGAIAAYEQLIKLEYDRDKLREIYLEFGKVLAENHQYDQAISACKKAISLAKEDSETDLAYLELGKALAAQNQLLEARKAYDKTLKINPNLGEAYWHLGKLNRKQNKTKESISNYLEALNYNSKYAELIKQEIASFLVESNFNTAISVLKNTGVLNDVVGYYRTSKEWAIAAGLEKTHYKEVYPSYTTSLKPLKTPYLNLILPLHDSHRNLYMETRELICPAPFVVTIPNGRFAIVENEIFMVTITPDNRLLLDINFNRLKVTDMDRYPLPELQNFDGTLAAIHDPYSGNYGHWMFGCLPLFGILEQGGFKLSNIDKIFVQKSRKFQKITLEILGIPQEKILETNTETTHIRAKSLIIPSWGSYINHHIKYSCDFLRDKFLPLITNKKSDGPERLYITRRNTGGRRVINEEEVLDLLAKYGFTCVTPESMSFMEQVELFAFAKAVMGSLGSWMYNLTFCSPGTKLIGLALEEMLEITPWLLAQELGLEYYYFLVSKPVGSGIWMPIDCYVDINALREMLKFAEID